MKLIKKFNENTIYLDGEDIDTDNQELTERFDIENMKTSITVNLDWYIEKALVPIARLCSDNDITPSKEVIDELVEDIKDYVEEYILYIDNEYTNWEKEFSHFPDKFLEILKLRMNDEYKKYEKTKKAKDFNL